MKILTRKQIDKLDPQIKLIYVMSLAYEGAMEEIGIHKEMRETAHAIVAGLFKKADV